MSKARKVSTRLAAMLASYLGGKVSDDELVGKLRTLAKDIEGEMVLKAPRKVEAKSVDAENSIFEYWQMRMGKGRAKFGSNRRRLIRARMKDGYTEEQLKSAIDACSASEFHMGSNDRNTTYNDIDLIMRSGEQVEKFMELGERITPAATESSEVRRLLDEAADAMQRGDTATYNNINRQLKEARN